MIFYVKLYIVMHVDMLLKLLFSQFCHSITCTMKGLTRLGISITETDPLDFFFKTHAGGDMTPESNLLV